MCSVRKTHVGKEGLTAPNASKKSIIAAPKRNVTNSDRASALSIRGITVITGMLDKTKA